MTCVPPVQYIMMITRSARRPDGILFSIPPIILALTLALAPSSNSDPGSHSGPFNPVPTTIRAFISIARRRQHFSSLVESRRIVDNIVLRVMSYEAAFNPSQYLVAGGIRQKKKGSFHQLWDRRFSKIKVVVERCVLYSDHPCLLKWVCLLMKDVDRRSHPTVRMQHDRSVPELLTWCMS